MRPSSHSQCRCAPAPDGGYGGACNEEAFRHLLGIELTRSARSGHAVVLVTVTLRGGNGRRESMPPDLARRLFSGLLNTVRDSDIRGWWRAGRVVGAALQQDADILSDSASLGIYRRLSAGLAIGRTADHLHLGMRQIRGLHAGGVS